MKFNIPLTAILAILMLFDGMSASGQTKPEPLDKPQSAPPPSPSSKPGRTYGIGAPVDPGKYIIGPEDVLFIKTWRDADFTYAVAVRPDGKSPAPLSDDVQAAGLTPAELTKNLTTLFSKFLNNPDVNVYVQEVLSKKYYIDGEVRKPGAFPLVTPTTILEALSQAGGFQEFANTKAIKILRGDKVLKFNYKQVTNGKHLEQNILVENGDHIIVH